MEHSGPEATKPLEPDFEGLFNSINLGLICYDSSGVPYALNPAAERILGLSLGQLQGNAAIDPRWAVIQEDGSPFPESSHPAIFAVQTIMSAEAITMGIYNPKVEHVTWISIQENTVFKSGMDIIDCIYVSLVEITQFKTAEFQNNYLEKRYRSFIDQAAPDALFIHGSDGNFIEVNRQAAELTGYAKDELLLMNVAHLQDDFDWEFAETFWASLKTGQTRTILTDILRKDGGKTPVEIRFGLLVAEGVRLYVVLVRDHTDRVRMENQLRDSEFLLAESQRLGGIGSWSLLIGESVIKWTDETYRIYGVNPDTYTPALDNFLELLHPEDQPAMQQWIASCMLGEHPDALEFRINRPDGSVRTLKGYGNLELSADGNPSRMVGAVLDITEYKHTQEALQELNDTLEHRIAERTRELEILAQLAQEATLAKSAFLANMNHEIRTPITTIVGMAELMRINADTPQQLDLLNKQWNAAQHLLHILNDVLDLSKIEAGKLMLEELEFDVNQLVEETVSMFEDRAREKSLQLSADVGIVSTRLLGDVNRIKQILLNYVNNAVKFTEQGCITVRLKVSEDVMERVLLRFEVQDTGIGIAPEISDRIFNSFEQADNSTTRQYGGTGLGLAIVRQLSELMHGKAGVESVVGVGSTFWCTLLLRKADTSGTEQQTGNYLKPCSVHDVSGCKVLVVDDVPVNLIMTQELLETWNLLVDTASDGLQAVELAGKQRYDLILMDMQMPKMDGCAATRSIRQQSMNMQTPIIALTGNAQSETQDQSLDAGMNGFITKPFSMAQLHELTQRWLSSPKTN